MDIGNGAIADSGGSSDSTIVFYAALNIAAGAALSLLSFVGVSVPFSWRVSTLIQIGFGWFRWVRLTIMASASTGWRSLSEARTSVSLSALTDIVFGAVAQQFARASISAEPTYGMSVAKASGTTAEIGAISALSFGAVVETHASPFSIQSGADVAIAATHQEAPSIAWSAEEINVFTKRISV